MLTTLKNAFKIKEIRNKLLFTLGMLVVIRLGSQLPVPGVNRHYFSNWFAQQTGDAFSFFDAFTGGSFLNMSVLALNITPYITSSIIMQLLTIAIPKLEEMQKEGEDGRRKIASITRYVTVALALIESSAMAFAFGNSGLLEKFNFLNVVTVIAALTAGSAFLMWIGERITEKGVGNGISIVLVINIISRIPQDIAQLFEQFVFGRAIAVGAVAAVVILAIILVMVIMVIILNDGVRKIPVQYAKKVQGRKMVGGQTSSIPLKVNTSGVIPIIFASSLMQLPIVVCSFFGYQGSGFWGHIAENMKKQGGFIPGIRPGKPTSEYLTKILNYIVFIGAIGLTIVCVVPFFFNGVFGAQVSFGGTSLIIIVSVVLETMKQIESQMLVRNYKGFLND